MKRGNDIVRMPNLVTLPHIQEEGRQEIFPWGQEKVAQPDQEKEKQKQIIDEKIRRLAKALENAEGSVNEYIKNYINRLFDLFHRYSILNSLMIFMNKPTASFVRGKKGWENLGRRVKDDATKIMIYVPVYFKKDKDGNPIDPPRLGFIMKPVYDISDTEEIEEEKLSEAVKRRRQELNEIISRKNAPKWFSEENAPEIEKRLMEYCIAERITVRRTKDLEMGARGVAIYQNGKSTIELHANAGISTFIHELAHVMLHHVRQIEDYVIGDKPNKKLRELEAEAVAYIVCSHFGIDILESSSNYLALYKIKPDDLKRSLNNIYLCSRRIIDIIEGKENKRKTASKSVENENQPILPFMVGARTL